MAEADVVWWFTGLDVLDGTRPDDKRLYKLLLFVDVSTAENATRNRDYFLVSEAPVRLR